MSLLSHKSKRSTIGFELDPPSHRRTSSKHSVLDSVKGSMNGISKKLRSHSSRSNASPERLEAIKRKSPSTAEVLFIKAKVRDAAKDRAMTLTLTNRGVYESSGSSREILDIHSVNEDPHNPTAFYITWFKSKQKIASSKLLGTMRSSRSTNELLEVRRYTCDFSAEQNKIVVSLEFLVRTAWQTLFEDGPEYVIRAPEIYQTHSCVVKVNRKGQSQDRVLVLSNLYIYNVEMTHCPTAIKEVKWSVPLKALNSLLLSTLNSAPSLHISLDQKKQSQMLSRHHRFGRSELPKPKHQFCLRSKKHLEDLVCDIRRTYFQLEGKQLLVECNTNDLSTRQLNDDVAIPVGDIGGFVSKYHRNNSKWKAQRRFVKLTSSGVIQWSESPIAAKYSEANVKGVVEGVDASKHIPRSFSVKTDVKTLKYIADTDEDFALWMQNLRKIVAQTCR